MEHFLRGREFEDIDHVEAACQEFFNSKEPYHRGIELLGQRWSEVLDNNGEYTGVPELPHDILITYSGVKIKTKFERINVEGRRVFKW
jgi:hypothetical protein